VLGTITTLEKLWDYCDNLHEKHFPDDKLLPIMGNGKLEYPDYMFVFINPTYRNATSSNAWAGFRAPWIGTKYIWKIFNQAGHFDNKLLEEIQNRNSWDVSFAEKVYNHLGSQGFYFTNLVKWTGGNADLPNKVKIELFLPLLKQEIGIVKPKKVIAFGLMPFEALTKEKIKLSDYYHKALSSNKLPTFDLIINNHKTEVIPCYFPVGRGNPKRAVELLKLLD